MLKIHSIENIKKHHNFVDELRATPAINWVMSEQLKDYNKILAQTVKKLEVVDNNLELIISKPDENIKLALGRAYHLDREISVRELRFPTYLPQGKVQLQRDLIKKLVKVAKSKKSTGDINREINELMLQGEWDANPKIGIVLIDDKETELRLHNSFKLFSRYLNACEHEFYKQALAAKLFSILHEYHILIEGDKPEPKLMGIGDYILNYSHLGGVTDSIYYHRAHDYLVECKDFWGFLDKNEYTRKYLLRMEDIHPYKRNQKAFTFN